MNARRPSFMRIVSSPARGSEHKAVPSRERRTGFKFKLGHRRFDWPPSGLRIPNQRLSSGNEPMPSRGGQWCSVPLRLSSSVSTGGAGMGPPSRAMRTPSWSRNLGRALVAGEDPASAAPCSSNVRASIQACAAGRTGARPSHAPRIAKGCGPRQGCGTAIDLGRAPRRHRSRAGRSESDSSRADPPAAGGSGPGRPGRWPPAGASRGTPGFPSLSGRSPRPRARRRS